MKQHRPAVVDYLILGPLLAVAAWAELVHTVHDWWTR